MRTYSATVTKNRSVFYRSGWTDAAAERHRDEEQSVSSRCSIKAAERIDLQTATVTKNGTKNEPRAE